MELTEVQEAILKDRFYHEGESSWYDVCERVARTWGDTPEHVAEVYQMMRDRKALPNTPAIANAGRKGAMGSACYVLPINDSLTDGPSSIMQTLKDAAAVHKSGGGTGFSFGRVRGKGTPVASTGRPAPGAVNVLQLYSDAISRVTQAGMRPGANMGVLPVDHPDIMDFIQCKQVEKEIYNFNISVAVTDEFMMDIVHDYDRAFDTGKVDVWDAIIKGAYNNGEPGILFIDTINEAALHPERIEATNPCGEVPLRPYEACVLGSVNLAKHVLDGGFVDWDSLRDTVRVLVRLLDNVISYQTYPIPEIEREQKRYRKIGVGVMGYADMLIMMGYRYGSPEALDLAEQVMKFIQEETYAASYDLAVEKGPYFGYYLNRSGVLEASAGTATSVRAEVPRKTYGQDSWDGTGPRGWGVPVSKRRDLCLRDGLRDEAGAVRETDGDWSEEGGRDGQIYGHDEGNLHRGDTGAVEPTGLPFRRNLNCQVIAPTGTISRLAGCSFGIEPNFSRRTTSFIIGRSFDEVHPLEDAREFVEAKDVTVEQHIRTLAAFQKYTDQAVSKTLNLPNHATMEDVANAYILAWQLGCKGTTVLREGSRDDVVLEDNTSCADGVCTF